MHEWSNLPQNIQYLLKRRTKLALELLDVDYEITKFCERKGIDTTACLDELCIGSDIRIYCEPWLAEDLTRKFLIKYLNN